jgi:hypothetical protein
VAVALIVGLQGTLVLVIRALRRRRRNWTGVAPQNALAEEEIAGLDQEDEREVEGVAPQPAECDAEDHCGSVEPGEDRPDETAGSLTAGGPPSALLAAVPNGPLLRQRPPQPDSVAMSTKVVLFDRRLGQRVAFVSPARLRWLTHDVACTTGNLSMRGLRCVLPGGVSPQSLPATGSAVLVTLTLGGTPVELRARVGWCRVEDTGTAVGLEFAKLRDTDEALLQHVVIAGTPV